MQRIALSHVAEISSSTLHSLESYDEIIALLTKYLPASVGQLFAKPNIVEKNIVEWYSSLQGQPILLAAERIPDNIQQKINSKLAAIKSLATKLEVDVSLSPKIVLTLKELGEITDYEDLEVYAINDEPVIVGWGLKKKKILSSPAAPVSVAKVAGQRFPLWLKFFLPMLVLGLLAWALWWFCLAKPAAKIMPDYLPTVEPTPSLEPPLASTPIPEATLVLSPSPEPTSSLEPRFEPSPTLIPAVKPSPKSSPKPKPPLKQCKNTIIAGKEPEMVIVFDNSGSMRISTQASNLEIKLFKADADYVADDDDIFRAPQRISEAKKAATSVIDKINSKISIRLLYFVNGDKVRDAGLFNFAQRGQLKRVINGLDTKNATPIYSAIKSAIAKVDGVSKEALILVMTDLRREDWSDAAPSTICNYVQNIAKSKPKLKINLVSIAGGKALYCIAKATKGQAYEAQNAHQIKQMINAAAAPMQVKEECTQPSH